MVSATLERRQPGQSPGDARFRGHPVGLRDGQARIVHVLLSLGQGALPLLELAPGEHTSLEQVLAELGQFIPTRELALVDGQDALESVSVLGGGSFHVGRCLLEPATLSDHLRRTKEGDADEPDQAEF